ncbi:hypothetical protein JHK82_048190 [Glycine max]|nr:hypothetical protein JHK82_048190 [Glycine max]
MGAPSLMVDLSKRMPKRLKKSVDPEKYTFRLTGRKPISLEEKRKLGEGYIPLLQTSIPEKMETLTSHFRVRVGGLKILSAFGDGFNQLQF